MIIDTTVPEWRTDKLKDVCDRITDGSHFSPRPQNFGYCIANVKDMRDEGIIDLPSCTRISHKNFQMLCDNGCCPKYKDVLLSKDGTIGKVIVYKQKEDIVVLSSISIISPGASVDSDYIGHFLRSPLFEQQIDIFKSGSALKRLVLRDIRNLKIIYPPILDEQRNIAKLLNIIDEAIEKTEQLIAKLKAIKIGLLHDLLTRGLDENGELRDPIAHLEQFKDSPLGRIPKEWEVSTIEQLNLQIIDGDRGLHYPNESQLIKQGFCAFLNNKNIVNGAIDFSDAQFISKERDSLLGKGKLNLGDIVITTRGTVGNIALFDDRSPFNHVRINSGMIILRAYENVFVPQFFLASWGFVFPIEYRRLSSGSAQPQFPIRDIQHLRLLIPERTEQERIVSILAGVDCSISKEQQSFAKLKLIKKGILHDLLTGKVRLSPGTKENDDEDLHHS